MRNEAQVGFNCCDKQIIDYRTDIFNNMFQFLILSTNYLFYLVVYFILDFNCNRENETMSYAPCHLHLNFVFPSSLITFLNRNNC